MLIKELSLKKLRINKRSYNQQREVHFTLLNNLLIVQSKDSCIYLSFSKTVKKPYTDKPTEGVFQICIERGKKNDLLLNFLHKIYQRGRCISTTDLCIKRNKEVYWINIEIVPIQPNGDLFRMSVEGINEILKILEIKTQFIPKVYQFVKIENLLLIDPEDREMLEADWGMNVVMKSTREFLLIEKNGKGIDLTEAINVMNEVIN